MRPGVQHVQFAAAHFAQRGEYQRVPHAQVLGRQHRQRDALLMGETAPVARQQAVPPVHQGREPLVGRLLGAKLPPVLTEPAAYALRQSCSRSAGVHHVVHVHRSFPCGFHFGHHPPAMRAGGAARDTAQEANTERMACWWWPQTPRQIPRGPPTASMRAARQHRHARSAWPKAAFPRR